MNIIERGKRQGFIDFKGNQYAERWLPTVNEFFRWCRQNDTEFPSLRYPSNHTLRVIGLVWKTIYRYDTLF